MKTKQLTTHQEQLDFLRKIEGQIRGVQRMIQEERYCIDIVTQIQSILGALSRVEKEILKKHIAGCVVHAFNGKSQLQKQQKVDEVMEIISKFRNSA